MDAKVGGVGADEEAFHSLDSIEVISCHHYDDSETVGALSGATCVKGGREGRKEGGREGGREGGIRDRCGAEVKRLCLVSSR